MHRMQIEMGAQGIEADFVAVNVVSGVDTAAQLVEQCAFPLLQDLEEVDAWGLLGGNKDDIYVFRADGTLASYLPVAGEVSTNLSTDEGYQNLWNAVLEAAP